MNFHVQQKRQKEQREMSKKQREVLATNFIAKLQQRQKEPSNNHEAPMLPSEEVKKRNPLRTEVRSLKKKNDEYKHLIYQLHGEIRESKQQMAALKHENWALKHQLAESVKELEAIRTKQAASMQKEKTRADEAEKKIERLEKEQAKTSKRRDKQIELAHQVKQLKETNKTLRHKLDNFNAVAQQEYGDLQAENTKLKRELNKYKIIEGNTYTNPKFLMKYLKTHMTDKYVPELLDLLEQFIIRKNLKHFYRGRQNLFYLWMRRVNLLNYHAKKREGRYVIRKQANDDRERMGYLTQVDGRWVFVDVTQGGSASLHPIRNIASQPEFVSDCPVKAFLQDDGHVIISASFDWTSSLESRESQARIKKAPEKREYAWFGNYRVLVIGSRFLNDYKNRLENHGCAAEIHNPFEESFEVLKGKVSRAEIILVCERHVPHSIWNHVDRSQLFVSVLKKDSKDLVSTYTYLTLQRCELI